MTNPVVVDIFTRLERVEQRIESGGGPPYDGGMEARVAKLEAGLEFVQRELSDIKADTREIKKDARTDFRITWGALIAGFLGIAGLMAKGFLWL